MNTWPFWIVIGLIIFNVIAGFAQVGKTVTVTRTMKQAILSLVVGGVYIWWYVAIMQHLC